LLKVEQVISNRPYVIKGKGCYIRVGSNSIPAEREAIINLCRQTLDRIANVEALEVITTLVKTELVDLRTKALKYQTPPYLAPIEVASFRDAAVNCRWLMVERNLMDENMGDGPSHKEGFFSTIRHIQMLNSSIERYNFEEMNAGGRKDIFEQYHRNWTTLHDQWIMRYLEDVIGACNKFLEEFH